MTARLALACGLLARALYCLERGWPAAAYDAIARAQGVLASEVSV